MTTGNHVGESSASVYSPVTVLPLSGRCCIFNRVLLVLLRKSSQREWWFVSCSMYSRHSYLPASITETSSDIGSDVPFMGKRDIQAHRFWLWFLFPISVVGLITATYLVYDHINPESRYAALF